MSYKIGDKSTTSHPSIFLQYCYWKILVRLSLVFIYLVTICVLSLAFFQEYLPEKI